MRLKCVDCEWEYETGEDGFITQEARDHLFFNEHHGFKQVRKEKK